MKRVNTDDKRKELEDKLSLELDLLLGEYVATGDDERKVNVIELFENSLQQAYQKGREDERGRLNEYIKNDNKLYALLEKLKNKK